MLKYNTSIIGRHSTNTHPLPIPLPYILPKIFGMSLSLWDMPKPKYRYFGHASHPMPDYSKWYSMSDVKQGIRIWTSRQAQRILSTHLPYDASCRHELVWKRVNSRSCHPAVYIPKAEHSRA